MYNCDAYVVAAPKTASAAAVYEPHELCPTAASCGKRS